MEIQSIEYDIKNSRLVVNGTTYTSRAAYLADFPDREADCYVFDPRPPRFATVEEAVAGRKADLAALRFEKETAGITLAGTVIRTDRESQALITGAWCRVQQNPNVLIDWKGETSWTRLDAATINAIAYAVGDHVQACFTNEKAHSTALDALGADPNTTVADIEAYDITTGWTV